MTKYYDCFDCHNLTEEQNTVTVVKYNGKTIYVCKDCYEAYKKTRKNTHKKLDSFKTPRGKIHGFSNR